MLTVAFCVTLWIPSLAGLGSLVTEETSPRLRRSVSGMAGLALLATLAISVNFAVPVNRVASGLLWLAGMVLAWRKRTWLLEGIGWWEVGGAVVALAVLVFLGGTVANSYDGGLYHVQLVRWLSEERLVFGLVNIHGRLAFNSAWLALAAAVKFPLAHGAEAGVYALHLPLVIAAAGAAAAIGAWVDGDGTLPNLAMAAMVLPIAWARVGSGTLDADAALMIIAPYALVLWTGALACREPPMAGVVAAQVLSVFALMVKASAFPLALGSTVLLLAGARRVGARRFWIAAVLSAGLAVPWMVRSVLLSGCLLYPVAASCMVAVPWTPPLTAVRREAAWVFSWARFPGVDPEQVLGNWRWLGPWFDANAERMELRILAGLAAVAWAAAIVGRRAARLALLAPAAIAAAGVAWWFFTAPDPRFLMGFALPLASLPLAAALGALPAGSGRAGRFAAAAVMVALAAWSAAPMFDRMPRAIWLRDASPLVLPSVPVARTTKRITRSGLAVNVPVLGDQCWDAPLPCTPYFDAGLTWLEGAYVGSRDTPAVAR